MSKESNITLMTEALKTQDKYGRQDDARRKTGYTLLSVKRKEKKMAKVCLQLKHENEIERKSLCSLELLLSHDRQDKRRKYENPPVSSLVGQSLISSSFFSPCSKFFHPCERTNLMTTSDVNCLLLSIWKSREGRQIQKSRGYKPIVRYFHFSSSSSLSLCRNRNITVYIRPIVKPLLECEKLL